MNGGTLTITTRINNSKINKDLDEVNNKIKVQEEKYKNTKDNINEVNKSLKANNTELDRMVNKYENINNKIKEMKSRSSTNGLSMNEYTELDNLIATRDKLGNSIDKVNSKIDKETATQKRLNIRLKEQRLQYEKLKATKQKLESKRMGIGDDISKMNSGLKDGIKTLSKYALALFGIRTIYSALSSAANSWLSSGDNKAKELSANIEYMKWAIGKSLQPIIETLVNWVYKLLSLINLVAQSLFRVNLFSKASAKDFKNAQDSTKGIAKNTKEASNNLAGFDKIDVLNQDKSSNGDTGGGSDFTMPTMNLGEDIEPPTWLKWILDNGDIVIGIIGGIATALVLLKLGLDPIKALGIGMAVAGIIILIKSVKKYLEEPTWENFGNVLIGLGLAIAGIAIAFELWPLAIAGVIVVIIGLLIKNWEKIKTFFLGIGDWFAKHFGLLGKSIQAFIKDTLSSLEGLFIGFRQIFDGILKIAKGDFSGGLKSIFSGLINVIIYGLNQMINATNLMLTPARALIIAFGKVSGKNFNMSNVKIPTIPSVKLQKGSIVNNPGRGVDTTIGENGAEMVLPLENHTEWMDTLANKIASKTGGGNIVIKANGTLAQLIRLLKLEIDKENSRVGNSLIIGGSI